MAKFIIDACIWIEYFIGSRLGEKIRDILENPLNEIFTNTVTIAEIISITKRENREFNSVYNSILALSRVYDINSEVAKEAGLLHSEIKSKNKKFSLGDAFVLITAKKLNAKVLTCDEDFRGVKEAVIMK